MGSIYAKKRHLGLIATSNSWRRPWFEKRTPTIALGATQSPRALPCPTPSQKAR